LEISTGTFVALAWAWASLRPADGVEAVMRVPNVADDYGDTAGVPGGFFDAGFVGVLVGDAVTLCQLQDGGVLRA
jgi:hypothetical protein